MSDLLVVGLGNPGPRYATTRHNAGWNVVSAYATRLGIRLSEEAGFQGVIGRHRSLDQRTLHLLLPTTFMNNSGQSVRSVINYFKINIDSVVVVYDELTLPLGRIKVSTSGSAAGHNGIASLLAHVGDGFSRLRVGIGPKEPREMDLADFVLSPFTPEQQQIFQKCLPAYVDALELVVTQGAERAMNRLNQRIILHDPA
jgi:PTH1 family peptidyl-tRNA hydrolase